MLHHLHSLFSFVFKRIRTQPGLTLATVLGLTVVVALMMSGTLYAGGAYSQLLAEEIEGAARRTNRPPFTYQFSYDGQAALQWEAVRPVYEYLSRADDPALGLPVQVAISHVETNKFRLFPASVNNYGNARFALNEMTLAVTTGLEGVMEVVEGAMPQETAVNAPIEVLITRNFADEAGLQVGEELVAYDFRNQGAADQVDTLPVRVAGIWQPTVRTGDVWLFQSAASFDDRLLVTEATFVERVSPAIQDEVAAATWYFVMDGGGVNTGNVLGVVARATAVENRVLTLLPEMNIRTSPLDALARYNETVTGLTNLLTIFNVPTIVLVLAFIVLVAGLSVGERRLQIAQMRSRGASSMQIVGYAALEGVLLGVVALALGAAIAWWLARLMGSTRSFLDFSAANGLDLLLGADAWRVGLTAVGLALLAQLLPVINATQFSIISVRQEGIHPQRPLWQRMGLDVILLLLALYGVYVLRQQGGFEVATEEAATVADPFQNPLLLVTPAMVIFAVSLLFLRLMPWVMRLFSAQLALTKSFVLLLTTRQLSRNLNQYATPLVLLVFTVSFSVFTSSLARTLDLQLFDEMFYRVGADVTLFDFGQAATGETTFLPMSAYEALPGVAAATRIGRFANRTQLGREVYEGFFVGIDREKWGQVAYWRGDFAQRPLGALTNALAQSSNSVLIPRQLLEAEGLQIGDTIQQSVVIGGTTLAVSSEIVGVFDYFPGWYPETDELLIVGNLDYLFNLVGSKFPYAVWLRMEQEGLGELGEMGGNWEAFEGALQRLSPRLAERAEPLSLIRQVQAQPERQGLFGLLSIGFAAAVFLTVLGFFLYALFSYRRRFVALGTMAALGLSTRQMMALVAWELAVLLVTGLLLGTLVGVGISREFVPYFLVGGEAVPPYLVEIAWPLLAQTYGLFGLLWGTAVAVLTYSLHRMKLFQALKLGEAV